MFLCRLLQASQSESVRKVQSERAELKRRVRDVEHQLQQEQQDHRDVTSGTGTGAIENQQFTARLITRDKAGTPAGKQNNGARLSGSG